MEADPDAMNVPAEPKEPMRVTAIRDAIAAVLPEDENIVSDVKIHDGLADISIRWRSLRFSTCLAIQAASADDLALRAEEDFKNWLRNTIKNMQSVPKHGRVIMEMKRWLGENPDKQAWLFGTKDEEAA
jgi:hypothetical protein